MDSTFTISYIAGAAIGLMLVIGIPAAFGFTLAKALSRRNTAWFSALAAASIATLAYAIFILWTVIIKFRQMEDARTAPAAPALSSGPRPLVAIDNSCQFTLPGDWVPLDNLNDTAEVQAGCRPLSAFLISLTENKQDLEDWTLEKFAQFKRDSLSEEGGANHTEAADLTVGNWPAKQWITRKTVDGVRIVYLCTCISTDTHFYYILGWSTNSRFSEAKPILKDIVASFQERLSKPDKASSK